MKNWITNLRIYYRAKYRLFIEAEHWLLYRIAVNILMNSGYFHKDGLFSEKWLSVLYQLGKAQHQTIVESLKIDMKWFNPWKRK